MGKSVMADMTVTFIGLKQGMFTAQGPDYTGKVVFDSLGVPAKLYATQILSARRIDWKKQRQFLPDRRAATHKGECGHVLVIGGSPGYSGAARLAGEAALRSGAGLVTVATHPEHAAHLNAGCPELMCRGVEEFDELEAMIDACDVIAIGPGLGQETWGSAMFTIVSRLDKPAIMDADALNMLAKEPSLEKQRIITPHPGEAARLLESSVSEVQRDRFMAARQLQSLYGGTVVLKGSGTIVSSGGQRPPGLCSEGNPGMATAGMGDVLTGIIASFYAQGLSAEVAAEAGVTLHAAAADMAARDGRRGMIASDLFPCIRELLG